jgi:HD-GYP domain-containing protein (c-di-GMP phosphodiesterase class II)
MANILLVGPKRERVSGVRSLLRQDGHQVSCLRREDHWREAENEIRPDLVVAAVEDTEGVLDVCGRKAGGFPAPLLFVQNETDFCHDPYLPSRLVDRITSPFLSEELLARVDALIRVRNVVLRDRTLPQVGKEPRAGKSFGRIGKRMTALLGSRVPSFSKPLGPYLEVAARLADWADRRDAFEPGHSERVTGLCAMIAEGLHLSADETASLLRAAMLHDIGKIALPVEVLHQKTPLEEGQKRLIRTHPRRGAALLSALDSDDDVASTILYHHERPDGEGYYGLDADSTPVAAKILALAEIYDAMTSCRLRTPVPSERALDQLSERKGQTVDSDSVEALVDRLRATPKTIPLARMPY